MSAPADHLQPAIVLSRQRRVAVTAGLLLGMFLAALEATVVSTAMPTVVASLGGIDHYSWVFSAYLLTSTASVPLWGRISDLKGRRSVYLAAIALFLSGSMLAGLSQTMFQLIVFRLIQGLGAGGITPLGLTIIGEIYTLAERTRMQAVFSSIWGVASIAGPLIGGIITDAVSWRWVFYVNLPIGLIAAFVIRRSLPADEPEQHVSLNWQGGLLLFAATGLVLVAFTEMQLLWAAMAVAACAAFWLVERRAASPILPLSLLANPTVSVGTVIGFLASIAFYGTLAYVPLFMQVSSGASATGAGQILTPLYLTWVLASVVAARMLFRYGPRACTLLGTLSVGISTALLPTVIMQGSKPIIFADIALMGGGLGFSMLSMLLAMQHSVDRGQLGVATSLNMFARTIGGAIGVSVMGVILANALGTSSSDIAASLETGITNVAPELRAHFVTGLSNAFYAATVAAGLAFIASFRVPGFAGAAVQPQDETVLSVEM